MLKAEVKVERVEAEGKMSKFNIQMTNDWVRHTDTSTKHGHETWTREAMSNVKAQGLNRAISGKAGKRTLSGKGIWATVPETLSEGTRVFPCESGNAIGLSMGYAFKRSVSEETPPIDFLDNPLRML